MKKFAKHGGQNVIQLLGIPSLDVFWYKYHIQTIKPMMAEPAQQLRCTYHIYDIYSLQYVCILYTHHLRTHHFFNSQQKRLSTCTICKMLGPFFLQHQVLHLKKNPFQ